MTYDVTLDASVTHGPEIHLGNVHDREQCAGRVCVIHNPTNHHMRSWPMIWRDDRGIFERVCEHGIGHPDPDQVPYWEETGQHYMGVHGCDGDCWNQEKEDNDDD